MGLSVTGGSDGIAACFEDLDAVSHVLRQTATSVTDAADLAAFARLEIGGCSGLDLGVRNLQLDDALAGLAAPAEDARRAADDLRALAGLVRRVAEDYQHADASVAARFGHALAALPGAVTRTQLDLLAHGPRPGLIGTFIAEDPAAVGLLASGIQAAHLPALGAKWSADGNPVVTDKYTDTAPEAVDAPRSVSDLVAALSERNDGASGEISVAFAWGTGGVRHAIVDIPGTKSWTPLHTDDVTSLATNLRAVDGVPTSYERGVLIAMRDAGVTSSDDVMLVGHSEGGMVAVAAARDGAAQFHISHVVTAGAPIGKVVGELGRGTQVLALEESHDVVPELDGARNPDRVNVTTVRGGPNHGGAWDNHHLDESYLPLAREVDASSDQSIRSFVDSAHDFLDQKLMTTERYVITREY